MGKTNIVKINRNTWRIDEDFVRFFLLEGEEKALLIDSGVSSPDAKAIAEGLTSKPVFLINTHTDGDHTSGNNAFDSFYITQADYEYKKDTLTSKPVFVKDGDVIDLGNRLITVYETPGHTEGSISLLDIGARVIYTGDSVSDATIYMFGEHRNADKYLESLCRLEKLSDKFDSIYPSHGTPVLDSSAVTAVREDFIRVLNHDAPFEVQNIFGTEVRTYKCSFTGFFMPAE